MKIHIFAVQSHQLYIETPDKPLWRLQVTLDDYWSSNTLILETEDGDILDAGPGTSGDVEFRLSQGAMLYRLAKGREGAGTGDLFHDNM